MALRPARAPPRPAFAPAAMPTRRAELPVDLPDAARIAGVDEAGRGALAGPVAAAAVMLPAGHGIAGLADSTRLRPARRAQLAGLIRARARAYAVAFVPAEEIDRINILRASLQAMSEAVARLSVAPDYVLADGRDRPQAACPVAAIVGGDATVDAICAASILAKEARDAWMRALDRSDARYSFAAHKGYPSAAHRAALLRLGPGPQHRRSYAPVRAAEAGR